MVDSHLHGFPPDSERFEPYSAVVSSTLLNVLKNEDISDSLVSTIDECEHGRLLLKTVSIVTSLSVTVFTETSSICTFLSHFVSRLPPF